MTTTDTPAAAVQAGERYYGFSALLSGLGKMWRATVPAVVFILINAGVQAGLVSSDPSVGLSFDFVAALVASVVMLLFLGAVLSAGAYEAAAGRAGFGVVMARMRRRFGRFAVWVIVQSVLVGIAWLVWPVLGGIVAWVLVYVPVAAVSDDDGNPMINNFRAIGRHPIRWGVTGVIIGILLALGFVLAALNTFFVSGFVGSALAAGVGGIFSWWYLTAWACLYRSAK